VRQQPIFINICFLAFFCRPYCNRVKIRARNFQNAIHAIVQAGFTRAPDATKGNPELLCFDIKIYLFGIEYCLTWKKR
jgi:hypothetical protein